MAWAHVVFWRNDPRPKPWPAPVRQWSNGPVMAVPSRPSERVGMLNTYVLCDGDDQRCVIERRRVRSLDLARHADPNPLPARSSGSGLAGGSGRWAVPQSTSATSRLYAHVVLDEPAEKPPPPGFEVVNVDMRLVDLTEQWTDWLHHAAGQGHELVWYAYATWLDADCPLRTVRARDLVVVCFTDPLSGQKRFAAWVVAAGVRQALGGEGGGEGADGGDWPSLESVWRGLGAEWQYRLYTGDPACRRWVDERRAQAMHRSLLVPLVLARRVAALAPRFRTRVRARLETTGETVVADDADLTSFWDIHRRTEWEEGEDRDSDTPEPWRDRPLRLLRADGDGDGDDDDDARDAGAGAGADWIVLELEPPPSR